MKDYLDCALCGTLPDSLKAIVQTALEKCAWRCLDNEEERNIVSSQLCKDLVQALKHHQEQAEAEHERDLEELGSIDAGILCGYCNCLNAVIESLGGKTENGTTN